MQWVHSLYFAVLSSAWIPFMSALNCYQCNTTWEMGCWYPYKIPDPGVDPKHSKPCPTNTFVNTNVTTTTTTIGTTNVNYYCVKEFYDVPSVHFGFNPFVNRTCAMDPVRSEDNTIIFKEHEEGCQSWIALTEVGNKTYEVERTICKCSSDNCNLALSKRLIAVDRNLLSILFIMCFVLISQMIL